MATHTRHGGVKALWGSTDYLDAIQSCRSDHAGASGTAAPDLAPWEEVGGYRLVRRIGGGSQADVWEARRADGSARPVALRVLRVDLAESPGARAAFLRSAELTRRLRGRSQLPTLDAGESRGVAYQALPLVRGASLADAIAARRAGSGLVGHDDAGAWWTGLRPGEYRRKIVGALAGVARGLAEAHAKGVVHRDLKPSNILLDREQDGLARLADFGLGTRVGRRRCEAGPSGTLMYMAPERLLGLPCDDFRCDIFALGMTLYEAVTLRQPRAVPEGLHRSLLPSFLAETVPAPPRSICPHLSRKTEAVILRAIAPDAATRYRKASVLADALDEAARVV